MSTTNNTTQTAQPRCSVCNKPLPASQHSGGGNQQPTDTICDSCKKKKKQKKILVAALLIGLAVVGAGSWYYFSGNSGRTAQGFGGVTAIEDSVKVQVKNNGKVDFNIASAALASSPASAQAPVSNIEDFNSAIYENSEEAKKNGDNTLSVPTSSLQFQLNSPELSTASIRMVEGLAKFFKKTNQQTTILVEGFTCDLGGKKINDVLSQQRAAAVKSAFVAQGIDPNKVNVKWYGKTRNKEFKLADQADYRRVLVSFKNI